MIRRNCCGQQLLAQESKLVFLIKKSILCNQYELQLDLSLANLRHLTEDPSDFLRFLSSQCALPRIPQDIPNMGL